MTRQDRFLAICPLLRILALLGVLLAVPATLAPGVALAQEAGAGAATAAGDAAAGSGGSAETRALLEILKNDESRARLISELERAAGLPAEGGADASAESGGGESTAPAEPERERTIGRQIADATQAAATTVGTWAGEFVGGLDSTQRRLAGFANTDLDDVWNAIRSIALVFVATVGIFMALRVVARPLMRRIGAQADGTGFLGKTLAAGGSLLLDVGIVIVAWAAGYVIALSVLEPEEQVGIYQALFLNAFLMVELIKSALRTVLNPTAGRMQLLPLSPEGARHWSWWMVILVSILGYGLLLVIPIVNEAVNVFTGRAAAVVLQALVLLTVMVLVIRHRKGPLEYYRREAAASDGDVTLTMLAMAARVWHFAAIAYLVVLFVAAVTEFGNVGPILVVSGKILAAVLIGAFVAALIGRASARGIPLPDRVTDRLPLLERRINTFVPAFLKVVRFVILLLVVTYALHATGIADVETWLRTSLGVDLASTAISVSFIVLMGFAVWLGLSSWVDFRLSPRDGRVATSRETTLLTLLRNAATIAIIVITLMFALSEIGIDIAPLIASAGVLGLAIGFGAQKMVQDIITGIFIQFENAINVGDVVTVGGMTGTVEKLTIRSVSLRDLQGVFHVIPFSSVDSVSNYMRGFGYHVADMGIAYREDIDESKDLMLKAFEELRADPDHKAKILGDLEWFGVQSLGDSAVVLRARIKCRPGDQWGVGRAYNELLKRHFDAAGVEIPFPHMTVWFGENKDGTPTRALLGLDRAPEIEGTATEADGGEDRPDRRTAKKPSRDEPLDTEDADAADGPR